MEWRSDYSPPGENIRGCGSLQHSYAMLKTHSFFVALVIFFFFFVVVVVAQFTFAKFFQRLFCCRRI